MNITTHAIDHGYIINLALGYQTCHGWEQETNADKVERRARKRLENELRELKQATEEQLAEISKWRISELREDEWKKLKESP